MATLGFSVSDELKSKMDELAKRWTSENGGTKSDFVAALAKMCESQTARAALPGRADEIEHVERLLESFRQSYMNSLQLAAGAREAAKEDAAAQVAEKERTIRDLQKLTAEQEQRFAEQEARIAELSKQLVEAREAAEAAKKEAAAAAATAELAALVEQLKASIPASASSAAV